MIYSSGTGATKELFEAVSKRIEGSKVFSVSEVKPADIEECDLIIIGSPTYFLKAREELLNCLKNMKDFMKDKNVIIIALYAIAGVENNIKQIKDVLDNVNVLGEFKLKVLWFKKPNEDDVNSVLSFIKKLGG